MARKWQGQDLNPGGLATELISSEKVSESPILN